MKKVLQLEEFCQMLAAIIGLHYLPVHFSWWLWIILFLLPDISMLGYLLNKRVGAFTYNLGHHKAIALILFFTGFFTGSILLQLAGLLLYGHSAMDRAMGYGLKYPDDFKHTHLENLV